MFIYLCLQICMFYLCVDKYAGVVATSFYIGRLVGRLVIHCMCFYSVRIQCT